MVESAHMTPEETAWRIRAIHWLAFCALGVSLATLAAVLMVYAALLPDGAARVQITPPQSNGLTKDPGTPPARNLCKFLPNFS